MPPCTTWTKPEKPRYQKRCLAQNMRGLSDPTRGVHGIMSEERHQNATYTTSATSRKLFCITPQVPTIRDMHEHSGAYLKTHTSMPRREEKRHLRQRKSWTGAFLLFWTDSKERQTSIARRCSRGSEERKTTLFTFLEVDGVEWHNNSAERGIRPCVILRNNSYGSRSEEGAAAIAC